MHTEKKVNCIRSLHTRRQCMASVQRNCCMNWPIALLVRFVWLGLSSRAYHERSPNQRKIYKTTTEPCALVHDIHQRMHYSINYYWFSSTPTKSKIESQQLTSAKTSHAHTHLIDGFSHMHDGWMTDLRSVFFLRLRVLFIAVFCTNAQFHAQHENGFASLFRTF